MDQFTAYLGTAGEIVSWIGLGLGLPLLFIALSGKAHDGGWDQVLLEVEASHDPPRVQWTRHGRAFERPLVPSEATQLTNGSFLNAFVSHRNPDIVRMHPYRAGIRAIQVAGLALTAGGAVGVALSLLPIFVVG